MTTTASVPIALSPAEEPCGCIFTDFPYHDLLAGIEDADPVEAAALVLAFVLDDYSPPVPFSEGAWNRVMPLRGCR